ncbi:Zinc finger, PMZ-type [Sesbania bispinosa]|nr:Zinc finger, PMZ-type [Sesbania bispinosa]
MADYKTLFTEPVLTTSLSKIEKDAAKTYTQEIFKEVKREIEKAGALIVIERRVSGDKLLFKLSEYCNRGKERRVDYDSSRSNFCCQCRLFESRGIPCSHIICVMKNEHVDHIPRSLVLARWTKSAKRNFMSGVEVQEVSSDVNNSSQIAALSAAFRRLCNVTEKNRTIFNDLMDDIFNVVEKYEKRVGQESSERSSIKEDEDETLNERAQDGDNVQPRVIISQNVKVKFSNLFRKKCEIGGCSSGAKAVVSQEQSTLPKVPIPQCGQGATMNCNVGAVPVYPQNSNVPFFHPNTQMPVYPPNTHGSVYPLTTQVPFYPQNGQLPIYPQNPNIPCVNQVTQYFPGMPNVNNATSISDLLQQVMKKGGQSSNGVFNFQ